MINSKLIDILQTLSDTEIKEFGKFVNSPYFNTNKKLSASFEFMRKFHNNLSDSSFTKEALYDFVFPGTKYRDLEIRKLLSGLLGLAEGFLGQKTYDNEPVEKKIHIAGALLSRNLTSQAEKLIGRMEEEYTGYKIDGQNFFYILMKIQAKKKSVELMKESFQTGNLTEDKINNFLLNYFTSFSIKILQNIRAKNYYNLISEDTELSKFFRSIDIEKFIEWLESRKGEFHETLIMNLSIIKCIFSYDENSYLRFKSLLLKNHNLYSDFEVNNLFTCLQGIQITRYRKSEPGALQEVFEVNNLILQHDAYAFVRGGNMPLSIFITMITIGIACNEIAWTTEFIEKYTEELNEKHREKLYNYAMAELSYAKNEPGNALRFASKIEYEGFIMKHEVNILKLKIYYDENDFVSLQYQLDTYKKLVEGNKFVGKQQYEIYTGFLRNYSELVKIKENNDKISAGTLLNKLRSSKNLISKEWLEKKASELI